LAVSIDVYDVALICISGIFAAACALGSSGANDEKVKAASIFAFVLRFIRIVSPCLREMYRIAINMPFGSVDKPSINIPLKDA
jgi:hypothetical protein